MTHYGLLSGMAPPPPSDAELFERAIEYAVSVFGRWTKNARVYVPELDPNVTAAAAHFTPVFQKRGYSPDAELKLVGYEVRDVTIDEWHKLYDASPEAALFIRERIAFNLLFGFKVPTRASAFMASMLFQFAEPPTRPAKKERQTYRDTLIAGVAKRVTRAFKYPLGANIETFNSRDKPPLAGCTIAAAAYEGFGGRMAPIRAYKISMKRDLPIDLAQNSGVLEPERFKGANSLAAYGSPEYFADAAQYPDELARAMAYFQKK